MTDYLLDCQCGKQVTVSTRDAGSRFACPQCQREITVPSLAKVKLLPEAPVAATNVESRPKVSLGFWLIVLGILKIVVSKILLPWMYRVQLNEPMPSKYDRWFYIGLAMLVAGALLMWMQRRARS